ncbi:MAG: haloacid dehalogenase type II [Dehalococcoidia bacterium]|nr:haloacid dehalogenase type II [Dehalococcoidia bacterium]
MAVPAVRALTFDVFGTVVDWRSSVIREAAAIAATTGVSGDWPAFADEWRYDGYIAGIGRINRGEAPMATADAIHRAKLDEMLPRYGLGALGEAARDHLNRAWHRLDPWPDSVAGLARLRAGYIVSTLSNGNVSLLVNMARHAGLTWDCILSAELTGAFKPVPRCYTEGARLLGLAPGEVMMVAAHKNDLRAAAKAGLRTAFVPRPLEAGPHRDVDLSPDLGFDINAADFHDLATQLGCA